MPNLKELNSVDVFVNGSCRGNPGVGGYSFFAYKNKNTEPLLIGKGMVEKTTNNRMELISVIEAVKNLPNIITNKTLINIYSSSAYLIDCMNNNWILDWKRNNWLNKKGKNVVNKDLWLIIDFLKTKWQIKFIRILKNHPNMILVSNNAKSISSLKVEQKND